MSADLHVLDTSLFIIRKTPFRSIPFLIDRRIPGAAFISVVHIFTHPVIRREKIHIFPLQDLSGPVNGRQSIFIRIFRIVEQFHIIFINQVFKFFFQVSDNNRNVVDSYFMELTDLALDHPFPKYLQKPLRSFKCQRHKPGTKSSSDDHRSVYLKRFHKFHTVLSHLIMVIIHYFYIMKCQTFLHQPIDCTQGYVHVFRHFPLCNIRFFQYISAYQRLSVHMIFNSFSCLCLCLYLCSFLLFFKNIWTL